MPRDQVLRNAIHSNAYISEQIRKEIQRFESVHPCIYTVYDLIELIPDQVLQNQLRDQVVCIEDAFVNSQEWTLSGGVTELKLGLVGSLHSGKTSLVHRFLTGAYTNEESPEGGRFKKEVVLDGQSYLLLIRDEGSAIPDYQFSQWVDAVIFVFSLESKESIELALRYYQQMSKHRNITDTPVLLVGTQDAVSESKPRVITEQDGRQMSKNLPRCAGYYETCSTYGLNVERVFKDACQKIIHHRLKLMNGFSSNGISTRAAAVAPTVLHNNHHSNDRRKSVTYQDFVSTNGLSIANTAKGVTPAYHQQHLTNHHQRSVSALPLPQEHQQNSGRPVAAQSNALASGNYAYHRENSNLTAAVLGGATTSVTNKERLLSSFAMPSAPAPSKLQQQQHASKCALGDCGAPSPALSTNSTNSTNSGFTTSQLQNVIQRAPSSSIHPSQLDQAQYLRDELFDNYIPLQAPSTSSSHLLTPSSTPNTQRRNRRISNLFQRPKDHSHDDKTHRSAIDINMGMGRAIPVKQGHLYKRSSKTLNKEWKKKYVCLHSDGRLSYHQTLKDYMEKDERGKEIFLGLATVRVAGRQRPRGTQRAQTQPIASDQQRDASAMRESISKRESIDPSSSQKALAEPNNATVGAKGSTEERLTPGEGTSGGSDDQQLDSQQLAVSINSSTVQPATPSANANSAMKKKKGHRRLGSATKNDEEEDCEFEVITCDQKRWEFSASSVDERNEWVVAIESLIEKALQAQMSQKQQTNGRVHGDKSEVQALRQISGNDVCADCGSPRPDWASLNLGTLICIECSGIHRNLGSHISKVRSLDLDDWPVEYLNVMEAIGNTKANAVWEHGASLSSKPKVDSPREEKEKWIKIKYEYKQFLPPIVNDRRLGRQLLDAVFNNDLDALLPILPRCNVSDLQTTVNSGDRRTALHIACSNASAACTQLLVWYNADLYALDELGRSALWHAQTSGAVDCASILLNAGVDSTFGVPNASESPVMIIGSLSSREYCAPGDKLLKNDAKLRRQSDVVIRRISANNQFSHALPLNGYYQRASDAFERLPASVI